MFLYFSNLYAVKIRHNKYTWISNQQTKLSIQSLFSQSICTSLRHAAYRSSVGATGEGLDAAALCALAALTVKYEK